MKILKQLLEHCNVKHFNQKNYESKEVSYTRVGQHFWSEDPQCEIWIAA